MWLFHARQKCAVDSYSGSLLGLFTILETVPKYGVMFFSD